MIPARGVARYAAGWVACVAGLCLPPAAMAQEPPDTADAIRVDPLVVTAERTATPLRSAVSAVSLVEGARVRRLPTTGFADALRLVPGFALVDFDGMGFDPQPMVRGFYGGGEVEYLLVLIDGRPVNDLQSGLMAWELVPPVAVERIEVVRGGASAVYGDAAIGGVLNVITDREATGSRWNLSAGEEGTVRAGARIDGRIGPTGGFRAFASGLGTDGSREHGTRASFGAGGSLELAGEGHETFSISARSLRRELDDPGPLRATALADRRGASEPFYRFDRRDEWIHRAALDGSTGVGGSGATLSGSVSGEARRTDRVSTIPLAPDFADTQERRLDTDRVAFSALLGWEGLLVGVDASAGRLDSEYLAVMNGPAAAYEAAVSEPEVEIASRGEAHRRAAAAFGQYELRPTPSLRLSVGARIDWLDDAFEPRDSPDDDRADASHSAFSPRAGANLRWLATPRQRGHVYLSAARTFKAPTLDQLFDQRAIPIPFPPFSATASNALLEPQRGVSVEAGAYHDAALASGRWAVHGSLAVYQTDMEDEIDFDVQTLSFVNIGRSRHRGVEAGLRFDGPGGSALFANYTLQAVTARQGEHEGKQLKAIPRHFASAGASMEPLDGVELGAWATRAGSAWIDDANTMPLPAWARVDARLSMGLDGLGVAGGVVFLEVRNLFDREYSTTAFPDPSGSEVVYHRPAAGRFVSAGVLIEVGPGQQDEAVSPGVQR